MTGASTPHESAGQGSASQPKDPGVGLIRANSELPRRAEPIVLTTEDGLQLVGELSQPVARPPRATLVTVHPLPTAGGYMDSHLLRKAALRLPAIADIAVLRFNSRGTESARGRSQGAFGECRGERFDLCAAMDFVAERGLPHVWQVGWSFGTDVILRYGLLRPADGAFLISPTLRWSTEGDLEQWNGADRPLVALIPGEDRFLRPDEARKRFAAVPRAEVIAVDGAKHLWVGEPSVRTVLSELLRRVAPDALPLPEHWPAGEITDSPVVAPHRTEG